ncbi:MULTISPECIES: phosphoribosyl-AMP cyclohydrolase [unclassified Nesterenkonia]|uniref:phosphoribosyl-AMP cyclohydrolase n=1 Tax=unclassified Nesterenkonia TaxID=2629769 RepID=UPI001F4C801F|nr:MULTISPECIES: phosphoribosyl-AMP cyclohydrolase [unclassified Nesterenkonia]MCH8559502.1 phosphoribosyl-AMP cyclohydrolase [Nesterenkonia sp. DZ6]MCH8561679.1 phosphoribosyl-AMP cyclohydrolase [Nesterenkonia sp. YGD6]MCH8570422.1 phosphoribosyl-AMP cyclohydrolase [Nesterenkonia sp. AY15]
MSSSEEAEMPLLPRAVREAVRFNADGLVPVITQDAETSEVLMLAWMNEEALGITLATRQGVYFSRSRQELWRKGATSGNVQQVVSLALDCDGDTVLMRVQQSGPACHTGTTACFTGREITDA